MYVYDYHFNRFPLTASRIYFKNTELLKCYFFINLRNALLEGDISIEITSVTVTVGICIRCIYKQLAIPPTIPIYTFGGNNFALYLLLCFTVKDLLYFQLLCL
jgi:hypothetical protein